MKRLLAPCEADWIKHCRVISYLLVGAMLFIIDYATTLAAYHLLGLAAGYASGLGFLVSFLVGFSLNKSVVFKHSEASKFSLRTQVVLYLVLAFSNLLITSSIVSALVGHGTKIEIVKPGVVAAGACWNYFILGHYVFGHKTRV